MARKTPTKALSSPCVSRRTAPFGSANVVAHSFVGFGAAVTVTVVAAASGEDAFADEDESLASTVKRSEVPWMRPWVELRKTRK